METYKSKFTETNFKENLANFFPLIHQIMQETDTVDLEDFVKESDSNKKYTVHCSQCGNEFKRDKNEGYSHCKDHFSVTENVFNEFEEWADAVEQRKLTDDQIDDLKRGIEELPDGKLELGAEGETAWQFFSQYGLNDSDLEDKLKSAADVDLETDPLEVLQVWAQDNYPELLVALGISGTDTEQPAPAEQPVAEGKDGNMVQEVAKIVKSFYNKDNPDVGPFRGNEGIAIDVEKQIGEKFGEKAGQQARQMAEQFMEKLTMEWQQRHGQSTAVDQGDGLARLKELVGNIKQRVEGIEEGPEKSQVPAYLRKEKGGDWKTSTKDLEKEKTASPTTPTGLAQRKKEVGVNETNAEIESILSLAGLKK
jgi:hypothetical protein